jgi:hypothetical protein
MVGDHVAVAAEAVVTTLQRAMLRWFLSWALVQILEEVWRK